jgi:hypothetical protein
VPGRCEKNEVAELVMHWTPGSNEERGIARPANTALVRVSNGPILEVSTRPILAEDVTAMLYDRPY